MVRRNADDLPQESVSRVFNNRLHWVYEYIHFYLSVFIWRERMPCFYPKPNTAFWTRLWMGKVLSYILVIGRTSKPPGDALQIPSVPSGAAFLLLALQSELLTLWTIVSLCCMPVLNFCHSTFYTRESPENLRKCWGKLGKEAKWVKRPLQERHVCIQND